MAAAFLSAAAAACFLGLSSLQRRDWCAQLVVSTTVVYGLLFGMLKLFGTVPPGAPAPDWRERKLSTLNALILILGSCLCFCAPRDARPPRPRCPPRAPAARAHCVSPPPQTRALALAAEWPSYEGAEGWISRGVAFWPIFFASLFVGYLQWDVLWMLWHSYSAVDELAHHLIFIAITHFVLWGRYFARPFAWLAFTELSTPFLNERWCDALRGQSSSEGPNFPSPPHAIADLRACPLRFLQSSGQRAGRAYDTYSLLFALTFLLTRVGGYGWGLVDVWRSRELWSPAHGGLYVVIALLHVGYGLNLRWASKVVGAAQRAMKGQHSK
jgi:hypothetical protein